MSRTSEGVRTKRVKFGVAAVAGLIVALGAGFFWVRPSRAQSSGESVDKMWVLDCGVGHSNDMSGWTNEMDVGKPLDIPVSCYLIHHATKGYFLWDTGISDWVTSLPNGWQAGGGALGLHWTRAKTVASQLAGIGVKPSDIHMIGISHTHPDHIGNVEEFPDATVYIQRAEYEYAFTPGAGNPPLQNPPTQPQPSFRPDHPVKLLQGDADVFGDGSVMLIYTPGHTPGHQSCLVHLPKTGWVVLSGDAVHLRENWEFRRIPHFFGMAPELKIETLTSMERLAQIMDSHHAPIWINHDKGDTDKTKHAPEFYD